MGRSCNWTLVTVTTAGGSSSAGFICLSGVTVSCVAVVCEWNASEGSSYEDSENPVLTWL